MLTIDFSHGRNILLPEDWTEVEMNHREQVFSWFIGMLMGQMTPFDWQLRTLILLTGYQPSRQTRRALRYGNPIRNEIEYNLIRLAELLDFPWVKCGADEQTNHPTDTPTVPPNRWILSTKMLDAPFPCKTYFRRSTPFIETNLTARQFVDAVELLSLINEPEQPACSVELLMKKMSEVVGAEDTGSLVQNWALTLWMTGVVQYFYDSPRYGILYKRVTGAHGEQAGEPMMTTLLEMQERGYQNPGEMPVEEYHEVQLKMLRDNLRKALSEGVKKEELVQRTGIPINFIEEL